MEEKKTNFSILVFPWLAHGHVYPYLELAKILSRRNFQIYFCSTAINLSSISDSIERGGFDDHSIQLVELTLPSLPDLPPQYPTTKHVPPELMTKLFQAFEKSSSSFSTIISSLNPDLLIYDVFQPWAPTIASSLGIPAIHFATSGAAVYSFHYHRLTHGSSAFPYEAMYQREHELKALQAMRFREIKDPESAFAHFSRSCEIVLMRTCREMEGKYIDYLSILCKKRIIPVGPLITYAKTDQEDQLEIMEWLNEKSPSSTVFISFGSENYLPKDLMGELAKGLESCDVNFIWVVRFPFGREVSLEETLPHGFLDRIKERGLIVQGWAPQAEILAHPSVGGFVSHCGQSSMIESIYFGVPVIAIPLKLDQPLNARVVVEAGVGVEVERDGNRQFTREDLANAIYKAVVEKTGEDMRTKAAELSKKMKNEEEHAVNDTAEQLRQICMGHKQQ